MLEGIIVFSRLIIHYKRLTLLGDCLNSQMRISLFQ